MALKKYVKHFFKVIYLHSVQPSFCWRVESPTKFSNLNQDLNFQRKIAGKEGVTFFSRGRGCSFYMKNKLKSQTATKVYKEKCLSAKTKHLNWQILTKNLAIFRR